MATVDFPSTLPGPNQVTTNPKTRARNSGLPGSLGFTAPERDYYGTLDVSFFLNRTQAAIFKAWWDTNQGYWFNAVWPRLSQTLSVYRFLGTPTFNHVFDGAYRVSAKVELRGASLAVKTGCIDGPVWASMSPVNHPHFSIAYGNGRFVVGDRVVATGNATASWSTVGTTWTAATTIISSSGTPMKIEFGNAIFFGYINAVQSATSIDGDTWVERSHPSFSAVAPPWFGGGTFIMANGSSATILRTVDGVSYTSGGSTPSAGRSTGGGCYGNGVHVAHGPTGACYSLDNGASWAASTVPGTWSGPRSMTYGNAIFVAFGNGGTTSNRYYYSLDNGATFLEGTLPASRDWWSVIYSQGAFLGCSRDAFGGSSTLTTSSNGTSWVLSPNSFVLNRGFTNLKANDLGIYVAISSLENSLGEVGQC